MDLEEENINDFSAVVENILQLFGNLMNKDVIYTIVESCGGDLNLSVDAIMNMTNDGCTNTDDQSNTVMATQNATTSSASQNVATTSQQNQPSTLYSAASQAHNTGAIPKQIQTPTKPVLNFWTDQIRDIVSHHNQGHRILLMMRGAPGSGKSYLARNLVEMMIGGTSLYYRTHIFSTDDYFMVRGQYQYDKYRLSEAHMWNQNRVRLALQQGLSPVIVDNTNIEPWQMEPYVKDGVANGYIIEVVEPNTPWARKAGQLLRKNIHNVPIITIKRMLEQYCNDVTGVSLQRALGLSYPRTMVPPVRRLIPAVPEPVPNKSDNLFEVGTKTTNSLESTNISVTQSPVNIYQNVQQNTGQNVSDSPNADVPTITHNVPTKPEKIENSDNLNHEEELKQKLLMEAQKRLEEIEKVEQDWENGENWDDNLQSEAVAASDNIDSSNYEPKPPRNYKADLDQQSSKNLMLSVNNCQDWSQISLFMPPWTDNKPSTDSAEEVPVQTTSSGTCMEIGDVDAINGKHKVITAVPRYINEFSMAFPKEKIPEKRMLDKSSMTNEQDLLTGTVRCKNEEKHFIAFRKLFRNIARAELRDIFDKCHGDANWAVDIVLDGMVNKQFRTVDTEELSDIEDESMEQCDCVAAYNIIPDRAMSSALGTPNATPNIQALEDAILGAELGPHSQKKSKKDQMSDESRQIKRQIEQNVTIHDSHYSEHCLKIRKWRRGEVDTPESNLEQATTSDIPESGQAAASNDETTNNSYDSDDEDSNSSANDSEKIVSVILGGEFVSELDKIFGREDMVYPDYIIPKVSLPLSLLNEINAFWMESLMHQIEMQAKQSAIMMQQDEEFARQLAAKEAELAQAGKEPPVPDFKEIMDLDAAVALYQKDVAEWRNNMPNDMAAKMTREKLYNLFPDIEKDTLSELLMAHDNNFQSTVEVLLISMGRSDIVEKDNGVNKFVMEKELQRQETILEEKKKALSETEWPLLGKKDVVEMSTVQAYRDEAEKHLLRRNLNYNKAQDYIRRGMTQVATHFSEIAAYHKKKFEQANSMAAASLMHVHAINSSDSSTIDLHYLHVNEAREAMDLFIDRHIQRLKESQSRGGPRSNMLFFITGRGLHSSGRPRIKPAVKNRLRERGLGYLERNPGLYSSRVCADDKLSYQIQVP